jgi:hypothetical protein
MAVIRACGRTRAAPIGHGQLNGLLAPVEVPTTTCVIRQRCAGESRHDRATGPVMANTSLWSLRGLEFEQRVAPSLGEVILRGVVDSYAVSA